MMYKVKKQYAKGTPILAAQFQDLLDAKDFIQIKLEKDARLKVNITYRLYEGMDLLQEFNQQNANASGGSSSSQQTSRQTFSPTPYNTAPRPAGMPHNWVKDNNPEDDKKK